MVVGWKGTKREQCFKDPEVKVNMIYPRNWEEPNKYIKFKKKTHKKSVSTRAVILVKMNK